MNLLGLSEDDLLSILSACARSALGSVGCCCKQLHVLTQLDAPWHAALRRDFDVVLDSSASARVKYRSIVLGTVAELAVKGVLTDGGMDEAAVASSGAADSRPPTVEEHTCIRWSVPNAMAWWVTNAFQRDERCFSSDVAESGAAAANIYLAGRITGEVSDDARRSAHEEAERRKFLQERLSVILQEVFELQAEGFGGIESFSSEMLDEALFNAWQAPGLRPLLLHNVRRSAQEETYRRLQHYYEGVPARTQAAARRLELVVTRQYGHRLLVSEAEWRMARKAEAAGKEDKHEDASEWHDTADPLLCVEGGQAVLRELCVRRGASPCPLWRL